MRVQLSTLARKLQQAKKGGESREWDVPEYVMEHVFLPLLREEDVALAELDYDRFGHDDLNMLEREICESAREIARLSEFNEAFCKAPPISATARAFC